MHEIHLKQLGFKNSNCGPITKKAEETRDLIHIFSKWTRQNLLSAWYGLWWF